MVSGPPARFSKLLERLDREHKAKIESAAAHYDALAKDADGSDKALFKLIASCVRKEIIRSIVLEGSGHIRAIHILPARRRDRELLAAIDELVDMVDRPSVYIHRMGSSLFPIKGKYIVPTWARGSGYTEYYDITRKRRYTDGAQRISLHDDELVSVLDNIGVSYSVTRDDNIKFPWNAAAILHSERDYIMVKLALPERFS